MFSVHDTSHRMNRRALLGCAVGLRSNFELSRSTSREAAHKRTHWVRLVAAAILLFEKALGIEGVRGSGDAGQN